MVKEITVDPLYLKIAVMAAAMVGLYALARGFTRKGPEDIAPPPPAPGPLPVVPAFRDPSLPDDPTYAPIAGAESVADRVIIRQHSFRSFDPIPGPPDPADFMDDLLLVVYYPGSDYTSEMEFTVATPAALARAIASSPGRCLQLPPDSFVVARYDHDVVMRAVLAFLAEQQGSQAGAGQPPDPGSGGRL